MNDQQKLIVELWLDERTRNVSSVIESLDSVVINRTDHHASMLIHTIKRALMLEIIDTEKLIEQLRSGDISDSVLCGGGR